MKQKYRQEEEFPEEELYEEEAYEADFYEEVAYEEEPRWTRAELRRRNRRRRRVVLSATVITLFFLCGLLFFLLPALLSGETPSPLAQPPEPPQLTRQQPELSSIEIPDWIDEELLDLGGSRSGVRLEEVNDIAIHYVGNPGTSAEGNRNYFNDPATEVNAHFLIGLDGEIIQCVPLDEKSAATNERNRDTISIEVCHPDETGQFTDASYQSLVRLCAWLCEELGLDETHLIRHYDVTGKLCPLYFVDHPEAWEDFCADVGAALRGAA